MKLSSDEGDVLTSADKNLPSTSTASNPRSKISVPRRPQPQRVLSINDDVEGSGSSRDDGEPENVKSKTKGRGKKGVTKKVQKSIVLSIDDDVESSGSSSDDGELENVKSKTKIRGKKSGTKKVQKVVPEGVKGSMNIDEATTRFQGNSALLQEIIELKTPHQFF